MNTVFYTIADEANMPYAKMMERSLLHFHPDATLIIYGEEDFVKQRYGKPDIFYLATPLFAQQLLKKYDQVVKIDADSLVTGSLEHILLDDTYDVGTVLNWNRVDPPRFGEIGYGTITPQEYYNNGFVVIRNKDFVDEWMNLCTSKHFPRMPFREQGFLNVLAHYGRFKVRCFDHSNMWHGLVSKGEWNKCVMKDGELVLPKAPDRYPDENKIIKVIHWAGGADEAKLNYKAYFNDECSEFLDSLVK